MTKTGATCSRKTFSSAASALVSRAFAHEPRAGSALLRDFGRRLTEEIRLSELTEMLVARLASGLGIERLALYLREAQPGSYKLARTCGSFREDPPREVHFLAPEFLAAVDRGSVRLGSATTLCDLAAGTGMTHAFPLVARGKLTGFLAVEVPRGGLSFEEEDVLKGLLDYAAIAAENALLYDEVTRSVGEVRALETFKQDIIESLSVGVLITDLSGVILAANPALGRIVAREHKDFRGLTVLDVLPETVARHVSREPEGPALFKVERGRDEAVLSVATTSLKRAGNAYGKIVTVEDVSERIDAQSRLLQQDKLASVGLLAAGMAHEINTPLAAIASYTQMVLEEMEREDPRYLMLKKVETQSFRAARIVQSLLNFSRKTDGSRHEDVDLNRVVDETLALVEHELKRARIELRRELDERLPAVKGDEGALQQVVLNLVKNALDAMPTGGKLTLRTSATDSEARLEVADSGHGISAADRQRIFDPFFTTKGRGKGLGLGLSVSYGLVREHGGSLRVASEPMRGACFTVSLPRAAEVEARAIAGAVGLAG